MRRSVFIGADVPMYAAGRDHALKEPSAAVLSHAAEHPDLFVTDAEVLQKILHRYLSLKRLEDGKKVLTRFATISRGRVEPVYGEDVERAMSMAERHSPAPSARDLLHVAVMLRAGVEKIVSADGDFDRLASEGIERLDPSDFPDWSAGP